MIVQSICLSDIPKDKMKKAANGKIYTNICCAPRKEKSQYGETHTVFMSQTKEEREAKKETVYIGGGIEYVQTNAITPESVEAMKPVEDLEDLPF